MQYFKDKITTNRCGIGKQNNNVEFLDVPTASCEITFKCFTLVDFEGHRRIK